MDMSAIQNFEPRKFAPMPAPQMQQMTNFKAQPLQVQAPRVLEYSPHFGSEGQSFTVTLQSSAERALRIGFGTLVVDTKQYAANGYVTLSCTIPSFAITRWFSNKVPLYVLQMENDMVLESWPFGDFTFYDDVQTSNANGKRSSTDRAMYGQGTSQSSISNKKQHLDTDLQISPLATVPALSIPRHDSYSAATTTAISTSVAAYDNTGLYAQTQQSTSPYAARPAMTPSSYARSGYYTSSEMIASHMPSYSQADLAATSTYAMTTAASNNTGYIHSHNAQPVTSSYMPQPHPTAGLSHAIPIGSYSPYSSTLNKANLKFAGNMDDMAINWTGEEWESHRRLVQFWRRQDGNDIQCNFAPVAPTDRQPNSIVVSCIYWAEKNDCFLTSVDCIYLLESLIAVRFTVEEKNRIRRNLEGFRPITVSKCKPESAEYFKLIMSFPNPKPRNIEKDVKVFPWKVLPYALKKIISKYTTSYSSTATLQTEAFHNANFPHGSTLPLTPQQQTILESSIIV